MLQDEFDANRWSRLERTDLEWGARNPHVSVSREIVHQSLAVDGTRIRLSLQPLGALHNLG